jgi:hypothetical protein
MSEAKMSSRVISSSSLTYKLINIPYPAFLHLLDRLVLDLLHKTFLLCGHVVIIYHIDRSNNIYRIGK